MELCHRIYTSSVTLRFWHVDKKNLLSSSKASPKAWQWDEGSRNTNLYSEIQVGIRRAFVQLGVNIAEDGSSFVSARHSCFFLTYQVLPQLFVVGDDAIVDDDKRCESSSKSDQTKETEAKRCWRSCLAASAILIWLYNQILLNPNWTAFTVRCRIS